MQKVFKWSLVLVISAGIASQMHAQQSQQMQLSPNDQPMNSGQKDRAY